MWSLVQKIFGTPGNAPPAERDPDRYEKEKTIAQGNDAKKRLTLARDTHTHQEILYYLAEKDPDPKVRRAVAENPSMPVHVSPLLATDASDDVRMALASRLMALLPDLSHDTQSQLYAFAAQALATLALDHVLKIRKALSSTLKDYAGCPPRVAGQLAKDIEREVAEPVLKFCSAVSDEDLLEILKDHPQSWAVQAIAARPAVSAPISAAVIDTNDVPGGAVLLGNEGASIPGPLIDKIIEKAKSLPEWHKPLASRKTLSESAAKKLAEFVDSSVRDILIRRGDFGPETTEEISAAFRRRLEFATAEQTTEPLAERLAKMAKEGRLNEQAIADAIALRDRDFVVAAIAHKLHAPQPDVAKILDLKAPKPIVAICWKANLSMRLALQIQQDLAAISPREILYPRNGTDFPMTIDEMRWQLDFFGFAA
ncbi:MAG: DUF2336 domain-containing protein [Rhodospirillales bacterium]|nr:DUF2336 domain-containing protein [Rhodospirillales bacterium]